MSGGGTGAGGSSSAARLVQTAPPPPAPQPPAPPRLPLLLHQGAVLLLALGQLAIVASQVHMGATSTLQLAAPMAVAAALVVACCVLSCASQFYWRNT